MRSRLPTIARDLGADERTFRRAVERGAVRCSRPGRRKLDIDQEELAYLRTRWELINGLTRALRTEPNVALAVLYGSVARGDERRDSDVDVLVAFRAESAHDAGALGRRLSDSVGRHVDVASVDRVRTGEPLLLLYALDDGRVLVDRDGTWAALQGSRRQVARDAEHAQRRARAEAAASLAMLTEDDG